LYHTDTYIIYFDTYRLQYINNFIIRNKLFDIFLSETLLDKQQ